MHLDPEGRLRMVDVSAKGETARRAVAECTVAMRPEILAEALAGELPKGDVLAVAQVAAVMAAKRTPELIPGCHPLRITSVDVSFDPAPAEGRIRVTTDVRGTDRTGFEMEALTACAVAALTVYDMCKGRDPAVEISGLRLVFKEGGKSSVVTSLDGVRAAVLTVSTSVAQGTRTDTGGPAVEEWLRARGATVVGAAVVPDEHAQIVTALRKFAQEAEIVISTGGTGMSPTDVTPEATLEAAGREVPGLAEAMRKASLAATPYALISRGVAATVGQALVVNLPGSPKAVAENLDAIAGVLPHALELLRGEHPH